MSDSIGAAISAILITLFAVTGLGCATARRDVEELREAQQLSFADRAAQARLKAKRGEATAKEAWGKVFYYATLAAIEGNKQLTLLPLRWPRRMRASG